MLDKKEISHIAQLSRLAVTEQEAEQYAVQLSSALEHFKQIAKVPTDNVEPLITPSEIAPMWREDVAKHETTTAEIVANAPEKAGNLFTVPPVV